MALILLGFEVPELNNGQILRGMQVNSEAFVRRNALYEIEKYSDGAVSCDLEF